jgi:hypothetical protein
MSTFSEVYAQQRQHLSTHVVTRKRPLSVKWPRFRMPRQVKTLPSKVSGLYHRSRRGVMYATGFGFIDAAAWQVSSIIGCLAVGVSLLVLEMLSGGDE